MSRETPDVVSHDTDSPADRLRGLALGVQVHEYPTEAH